MTRTPFDLRAVLMGVAFALMWSSAFTSARMIVADASPLTALALRFTISGLLAVSIAAALGQSARLTRAQWRATAIFGLCQNTAYLGLNFIAMQTIQAGLASIVASTMPLLVALLAWATGRERLRPLAYAGLATGFAGTAIIMGARLNAGVDPTGLALCILGSLALAFATLTVRTASSGGNLLMIVGLQMLIGAAALALIAAVIEAPHIHPSPRFLAAFAYTTLVPGLAATLLWFALVARIGATRASAFHFLNPFFGVAIAAVVLNERLTLWDALGAAIIAAGILAVQLARAKS